MFENLHQTKIRLIFYVKVRRSIGNDYVQEPVIAMN